MTITDTQRGTDSDGRQTNATGYRYYNARPGTVAAASSAVGSVTETSNDVLNPAFASGLAYATGQQQGDAPAPGAYSAVGPNDAHNPVAAQNAADTEDSSKQNDHSAQLPNQPTTVAAVAGATGHATVTWAAPVDADGYAITGYTVTATSSDGGTARTVTVGNVLTADVGSLTSTSHYTFTVAATNIAGTGAASAASSSVVIG